MIALWVPSRDSSTCYPRYAGALKQGTLGASQGFWACGTGYFPLGGGRVPILGTISCDSGSGYGNTGVLTTQRLNLTDSEINAVLDSEAVRLADLETTFRQVRAWADHVTEMHHQTGDAVLEAIYSSPGGWMRAQRWFAKKLLEDDRRV